jgi:hypothetical protein
LTHRQSDPWPKDCDCQTPATRKSVKKLRRRIAAVEALMLGAFLMLGVTVGALTVGLVKLSNQAKAAAAATKRDNRRSPRRLDWGRWGGWIERKRKPLPAVKVCARWQVAATAKPRGLTATIMPIDPRSPAAAAISRRRNLAATARQCDAQGVPWWGSMSASQAARHLGRPQVAEGTALLLPAQG